MAPMPGSSYALSIGVRCLVTVRFIIDAVSRLARVVMVSYCAIRTRLQCYLELGVTRWTSIDQSIASEKLALGGDMTVIANNCRYQRTRSGGEMRLCI